MTITTWPHFIEVRLGPLMLLVDELGAIWALEDGRFLRYARVGRC